MSFDQVIAGAGLLLLGWALYDDWKKSKRAELVPLRTARAFRCEHCRALPDPLEQARIDADPSLPLAVAWYCPKCAPELELACSGLTFRAIDVGGESPR